jgi:hypothetical protein
MTQHAVVVLNRSRLAKPTLFFAKSVATAMTDNPWFPSPTPTLAVFEADIAALAEAEASVLTRTKGTKEFRDHKLRVVCADLGHLKAYVQYVADQSPEPESALVIIASAGMSVKRIGRAMRGELEVRRGDLSGTVRVIAKCAGDRAAYTFEYASEGGPWTISPPRLQSKLTISGLTVGVVHSFRVRVLTKDGMGSYSQVVSLLVV